MSDEIKKEVVDVENEQLNKIKEAILKIENKKNKFMFCIPEVQNPSASVYEMYFNATVVKNMGYDVYVLTEKKEYELPKWIEPELTKLKHTALNDNKLTVGPEDVLIIPEVFTNIMEQTKNLPCLRIGLLQSVDYMMNALVPGTNWRHFGISDIITTSNLAKNFVDTFFVNKFNVKVYNPSIPDYFKRDDAPQRPVVSIVGRNPNEISKFVKLFYSKYPQYSWLTFDAMLSNGKPPKPMRRKDFAERLKTNCVAIWVDRISTWGTFPLECMKSGVVPISLKPDITPDYILNEDEEGNVTLKDNCGVWTDSFYDLPDELAKVLIRFLDDSIPDELYDGMEKLASEYTSEKAEKELIEAYSGMLNSRLEVLKSALNK